jgi:hypothetical protein
MSQPIQQHYEGSAFGVNTAETELFLEADMQPLPPFAINRTRLEELNQRGVVFDL